MKNYKLFYPQNRHLWVERVPEEKEENTSAVLLPEDYKPKQNEFSLVIVKDSAPDCQHRWVRKDAIIVEDRMLREIKIGNACFYTVQENYVLGVVK